MQAQKLPAISHAQSNHTTAVTADRRTNYVCGEFGVFCQEVNIADIVVYACFSLRTAASVHVAKWSPDGEYFATVGKVCDSCKHVAKQHIVDAFV